jgi:VWFA-related protein
LLIPAVSGASAWSGQFASGVDLVEVYATVTDAQGQPVTGLTGADFTVFEDDDPQTITTFAAGEFPLAVAVGLDRSFSMRDRLPAMKSAARGFVGALRPGDQVMVVAIGSEVEVVAPLSSDRGAAADAIDRLDAWGTTPLYDASLAAIDEIQNAKGRRALVLLSDGVDRYSTASPATLVGDVRKKDVLVYPIAVGNRPPVFAELAAVTGGRSFFPKNPRELPGVLDTIARELRFQYLLGYSSSHKGEGSGEWRSIRVSVRSGDLRVRARDGYVAR